MRPAIGGAIATPAASAVFPGASWASASEAEPGNACRCALDAAGNYVRTLAALGIDDVGAAAIECQAGVRDLRGARRIRPVPSPVTRDTAHLGYLVLHQGNWRGRQLVPADWVGRRTLLRLPLRVTRR